MNPIPRTALQEKRHQRELDSYNWHTQTIARFKDLSHDALLYIREDARKAEQGLRTIDTPSANEKCGQYLDEIHYVSAEIQRRKKYYKLS